MKVLAVAAIFFVASMVASAQGRADEAEVRKTLEQYVDAFNQNHSDMIAEFWTKNAVHTDRETGQRTEGRAAIQADAAEVLKEQSGLKISATIDRLRFITPDVASVEGETTLVLTNTDPIVSSYSAILVHQGDKWLLDSIEEMPLPKPASSADVLAELAWLIGEWVDDSGDAKVATTFRWTANNAFLLRSFDVTTEEGIAMTGTQIIGWDPIGQKIRSWSFNSDGSFGESTWEKNGDSWMSKSVNTLANGEVASGTYIMERLDDDSFTVQLVGHEIGGQPQPTGSAVKIVRAARQPSTEAAPKQ